MGKVKSPEELRKESLRKTNSYTTVPTDESEGIVPQDVSAETLKELGSPEWTAEHTTSKPTDEWTAEYIRTPNAPGIVGTEFDSGAAQAKVNEGYSWYGNIGRFGVGTLTSAGRITIGSLFDLAGWLQNKAGGDEGTGAVSLFARGFEDWLTSWDKSVGANSYYALDKDSQNSGWFDSGKFFQQLPNIVANVATAVVGSYAFKGLSWGGEALAGVAKGAGVGTQVTGALANKTAAGFLSSTLLSAAETATAAKRNSEQAYDKA